MEQLDELKLIFQNKLDEIQDAKERLLESERYCMICMDNRKNIVIQGCNDFVLCDKCEQNLHPKICPQCQKPYTNVLKLKI